MITTASEYEWMDVAGTSISRFVTGDIMPVRDNRNDGSWRVMKYEDMLFLAEARLERANWNLAMPSAAVTPPGRIIKFTNFTGNCVFQPPAVGWIADFVSNTVTLPSSIVATSQSASIADACLLATPPFASIDIQNHGATLKADDLRRMFYNVKLATRTLTAVSLSQITASWTVLQTRTTQNGDTQTSQYVTQDGMLWSHTGTGRYGSYFIEPIFSYISTFGTYQHCASAKLLVKTRCSSEATGDQFYDVVPVACSVSSSGAVSVPSLSGVAAQVCAAHAINYTSSPGYKTTDGGSIFVYSMALVCDMAFPAEINTLNWGYTPS